MKTLYRFDVDCGRSGSLYGMFIAEPSDVEALFGEELYFGEVLGKHSEVMVDFGPEDVTKLTDDQDFIQKFVELKCCFGFNPLDYVRDDEEDEDEDEDE